jgi:hypothetical protein
MGPWRSGGKLRPVNLPVRDQVYFPGTKPKMLDKFPDGGHDSGVDTRILATAVVALISSAP